MQFAWPRRQQLTNGDVALPVAAAGSTGPPRKSLSMGALKQGIQPGPVPVHRKRPGDIDHKREGLFNWKKNNFFINNKSNKNNAKNIKIQIIQIIQIMQIMQIILIIKIILIINITENLKNLYTTKNKYLIFVINNFYFRSTSFRIGAPCDW